ncbi:two-component regulator propeller domain-containing protein [Aestuariirhabdus litorea]|uniref:histidine kinase n=1 Tax=Aestuariirhabdus litorea TaxID=2528527 RepID=A0A3P3VU25_9GAMM|nr:two-component regulator propeller domain-containing protein [Aestuariirhabdus litorea]RRJ84263.1 diguanylate cyclase [Aestuariirhabdus litorea]RWW97485.1 diguanylate cyclase [Endozoicomonadaceae bacterium GTF-13]
MTRKRVHYSIVASFMLCLWTIFSLPAAASGPVSGNIRFSALGASDGLSQNTISAILQDSRGYLWFGTQDGLNRYDGLRFKVYQPREQVPFSLSDSFITALAEDHLGQIWVGTRTGLSRFDPDNGRFYHYASEQGLSNAQIETIYLGGDNRLWVGTRAGLNHYVPEQDRFVPISLNTGDGSQPDIRSLIEDAQGALWLGTDRGLYKLTDLGSGAISRVTYEAGGETTEAFEVHQLKAQNGSILLAAGQLGVLELLPEQARLRPYINQPLQGRDVKSLYLSAEDNSLWIGTDRGLFIWHGGLLDFLHSDLNSPHTLSNDHITQIYGDRSGVIWVGTLLGGVNKHVLAQQRFHYFHQRASRTPLFSNSLRSFYASSNGDLWIGTDNGLQRLNRSRDQIRGWQHEPDNPSSLSNNRIWALAGDEKSGVIWAGTASGGLNRLDLSTGKVTRLRHSPDNPNSLTSDKIRSLYLAPEGDLWIGTWGGGLNRYLPNGDFIHYGNKIDGADTLRDDRVTAILPAAEGQLWVGTMQGVHRFDPETGRASLLIGLDGQQLPDLRISSLRLDDQGRLWIGTRKGLGRYDPSSGELRHFGADRGLSNEVIYALEIARDGAVWVSTNRGLFRLNPGNEQFSRYTEADGLQADEFNTRASTVTSSGELVFGGISGFNLFNPNALQPNSVPPQLVLNDLRLFNRSVRIGDESELLSRSINSTRQITLNHRQSMISLEFAALHYVDPANNSYQYMLEGFDSQWINTDASRPFAAYTNLDSGEYRFRLRGANKDGASAEREFPLRLVVLPPPWRTWWAYLIYALLTISALAGYVLYQHRKLKQERAISRRLRELDSLKDEFLANTSHELRTPLNGIIGLADSMLDDQIADGMRSNLEMIVSSGRRLNDLVDNILTFAKAKSEGAQDQNAPLEAVDLGPIIREVVTLSRPLLSGKPVTLNATLPDTLSLVMGHESGLHQIFHNLVHNATKFTHQGSIEIRVSEADGRVRVEVCDSGIGISEDKHELVFEPFRQADGSTSREYGGTGLGLALTRQLAQQMGSEVELESRPGEGCCFSFELTASDRQQAQDPLDEDRPENAHMTTILAERVSAETPVDPESLPEEDALKRKILSSSGNIETLDPNKRFTILIVDDEPVNRQVLKNYLSGYNFKLIEAGGGEEALRLARQHAPVDLVLLDIMMPMISGYEVCKELRKLNPVNDLPILFLTAKSQVKDIVEGFAVGGNDYLTKPVAKYELQSRVQTHLQLLDINRDLEEKVKQRTAELLELNNSLQNAYKDLESIAQTDPLTGLFNRRYFTARIDQDVQLIDRHYDSLRKDTGKDPHNADIVFYMVDLDHFKAVNDTYGHAAGDTVLKRISEVLHEVLRESDYIVRWGGEEFLVVTRHTNRQFAPEMAERMRARIEGTQFVINDEGKTISRTCSIGYAAYPFAKQTPQGIGWSQVVDIADMALYAAKRSSRNAWVGVDCLAPSADNELFERLTDDPEQLQKRQQIAVKTSITDKVLFRWR